MFWDNKHLWAFMLDSLESLSMLCAKVPQPCPVPDRLCRQTWKNINRYLTSIARFMEKNINVEWEKMRLDFPSETGIKYETGRGIFLFEWSCCQARAELNQLKMLVQSELSIASDECVVISITHSWQSYTHGGYRLSAHHMGNVTLDRSTAD